MQKKRVRQNKAYPQNKLRNVLIILIILAAVLVIFTNANSFPSWTGSATSSRQKSLPDLKPIVFDAELIAYGEYQSRDILASASVANIGDAKAVKPVLRMHSEWKQDGSNYGSGWWADYELGPIAPNGGMSTVPIYFSNNLAFKYGTYYLSATADPYSKIGESNESNNFLDGYLVLNCTSAYPDPIYGFDCCLQFEGAAWKRSGTICY